MHALTSKSLPYLLTETIAVRILCKHILCVIPKKGTNLRLSWRSEGLRGKWKLVTGCDFASSAATPCLGRRVLIRDLLRPKEPRTTITQDTTSVIFTQVTGWLMQLSSKALCIDINSYWAYYFPIAPLLFYFNDGLQWLVLYRGPKSGWFKLNTKCDFKRWVSHVLNFLLR